MTSRVDMTEPFFTVASSRFVSHKSDRELRANIFTRSAKRGELNSRKHKAVV